MLSLVESKDQRAHSEMSRSVASLSWESWKQSHTLQGTALDAPWALLVCCEIHVCYNCLAVNISVVSLFMDFNMEVQHGWGLA